MKNRSKRSKSVIGKQSDGSLSLKVRSNAKRSGRNRHMSMGKRRAVVLALVNGLIIVHFFLWLAMGRTLSPVEPSESMQTLETGVINAGFVFFAGALLLTLIFGRYICGWGCHIIALQDLCRWIMLKLGVRPKPFRSRLLGFVPLGFALYMFVWPNFKRFALFPALDALGAGQPIWLKPVPPPMGFESGFLVDDFWATMPGWVVAIPFLLVVGFASVYFLGAKGFCTYGCPYGGFFAPADKLSPVRVRVTDACEGCAQCTAVCSSNVRVHEEVRAFGMVVDSGCMKTMDCIAACPNEALYIGAGLPAALARPKDEAAREDWKKTKARRGRTQDTSLGEEIVVAAAFVLMFLGFRGMFDRVPMLMAIGMAGVGAFGMWKSIRIVRDANVRLHGFQLKKSGRLSASGVVFLAVSLLYIAGGLWSLSVRYERWQGDLLYRQVLVPSSLVLAPGFAADQHDVELADRSLRHYTRADAPGRGGFGWSLTPDELLRVAYLQVVRSDYARAEAALRKIIERGNPETPLVLELAQVMRVQGADETEIAETLGWALTLHESLHGLRRQIALRAAASGELDAANRVWDLAPREVKADSRYWIELTRYRLALHDQDKALEAITSAIELLGETKESNSDRIELAEMSLALGDQPRAEAVISPVLETSTRDLGLKVRVAAILFQLGRDELARTWLKEGTSHKYAPVGVLVTGAQMYAQLGDIEQAEFLLDRAVERISGMPWEMVRVGGVMIGIARSVNRPDLADRGLDMIKKATERKPGSPALLEQLAVAQAGLGQLPDASRTMARAAALGASSATLASKAADLFTRAGDAEQAAYWHEQAMKRKDANP